MKICRNCMHWDKNYCICNAIELNESIHYDEKMENSSCCLFCEVLDDSGLRIVFKTSANFGCNKFSSKKIIK